MQTTPWIIRAITNGLHDIKWFIWFTWATLAYNKNIFMNAKRGKINIYSNVWCSAEIAISVFSNENFPLKMNEWRCQTLPGFGGFLIIAHFDFGYFFFAKCKWIKWFDAIIMIVNCHFFQSIIIVNLWLESIGFHSNDEKNAKKKTTKQTLFQNCNIISIERIIVGLLFGDDVAVAPFHSCFISIIIEH